jgi:hypothetical protein
MKNLTRMPAFSPPASRLGTITPGGAGFAIEAGLVTTLPLSLLGYFIGDAFGHKWIGAMIPPAIVAGWVLSVEASDPGTSDFG